MGKTGRMSTKTRCKKSEQLLRVLAIADFQVLQSGEVNAGSIGLTRLSLILVFKGQSIESFGPCTANNEVTKEALRSPIEVSFFFPLLTSIKSRPWAIDPKLGQVRLLDDIPIHDQVVRAPDAFGYIQNLQLT